MTDTTQLQCACGQTRLTATGAPIATVECCCTSCRNAAEKIQSLDGAPHILTDYCATPFVMIRKDRVRFLAGQENLKAFRLSPKSTTRRVIATCCNTPIFLEFTSGHWLSLYTEIWPPEHKPSPQMRTMTGDLPPNVTPPDNIPNPKTHNLWFYTKLLSAWVSMRFRSPKTPEIEEFSI